MNKRSATAVSNIPVNNVGSKLLSYVDIFDDLYIFGTIGTHRVN